MKTIRKELFDPAIAENIDTTEFCEMLGEEMGDCIVEECESKKTRKVTHKYSDALDEELSTKKTKKREVWRIPFGVGQIMIQAKKALLLLMMPYQQWVGLILVEVRVWDKHVTMVISIEERDY